MARLTRTQKFAALREELANSSEESHVNEDLNKFQDKLNSLESAFNKETEAKKEDFNLNVDPIPSFEEVKQEATLEETSTEEETKTSEELENNFLKDFDFENINKAIDEIVKQNVSNLDNNQDINIDNATAFNSTNDFTNPASEYVEEKAQEETDASFKPVQESAKLEETITEPIVEEESFNLENKESTKEEESHETEESKEEPIEEKLNQIDGVIEQELILENENNDDSASNDFDLDLSDLSIPDFTEEASDIVELKLNDEKDDDVSSAKEKISIDENKEETLADEVKEVKEELNFVEKDYSELANDLAINVEELVDMAKPIEEEIVSNSAIEEIPVEEPVTQEAYIEKEEPILSNGEISSLLDDALIEIESYNNEAGRSTVKQISNDLIDEVRHKDLPKSEDDDEFSNTVTLEIDKVLSEINLDTMSSLKIDDVLEDKKEVEPLEVKPEDAAEKLADTIAHPVLAKSLEEEPVEIKSMEETFTSDAATTTIAFDNKKLEKEDTSVEDYYYDDDKPNKILNVILIILMIMLVGIIGVIVYYILYAKGVIG